MSCIESDLLAMLMQDKAGVGIESGVSKVQEALLLLASDSEPLP